MLKKVFDLIIDNRLKFYSLAFKSIDNKKSLYLEKNNDKIYYFIIINDRINEIGKIDYIKPFIDKNYINGNFKVNKDNYLLTNFKLEC